MAAPGSMIMAAILCCAINDCAFLIRASRSALVMGETPEVIGCNDDELFFALAVALAAARLVSGVNAKGANAAAPESLRKSRFFIIIPLVIIVAKALPTPT